MTADEIRAIASMKAANDDKSDLRVEELTLYVLAETAAQLAEINANLRDLVYAVRSTAKLIGKLQGQEQGKDSTPRRWR